MKWRALILGGGGATGEFQMGALPVVAERYDRFDLYLGVGVGSLHASVLAQYDSVTEGVGVLQRFWKGIDKTSDLFDTPIFGSEIGTLAALASDKSWARDGAYGSKKFKKLIGQNVSWDRLKGKNNWAIEVTSLSDGRLYVVTNNEQLLSSSNNDGHKTTLSLDPSNSNFIGSRVVDFVTASGSVPLMLPPIDIFGHRFVEGGLRDFTPLRVAVQAFEHAMNNGYTEAEFVIIDNYTNDAGFEGPELLDSGSEIVLRAIKIMTIEMAQNDVDAGKERLEELGTPNTITLIQPKVDYRLHPMDFGNHTLREAMRNHGNSEAEVALGAKGGDVYQQLITLLTKVKQGTATEAETTTLTQLSVQHPGLARAAREETGGTKELKPLTIAEFKNDVFYPDSLGELVDTMISIRQQGKTMKAVGAGYTFSNVLETDGAPISLKKLRNVWNTDVELLNDPSLWGSLCEFEAGATINDLNSWLWPQQRTLINQPGFEKLNYLGVATTGGHGSGINIGPIADAIRSMHVLFFDASNRLVQHRIEPTNGITNRQEFSSRYPGVTLVQDDDVFNAHLVSAGTMGIVYSLIVDTQERFFLEEQRRLTTWRELKPRLNSLLEDKGIHSIHIWFNPYPVHGDVHCVLTEYRRVSGPRRGKRPWGTSWNGVDEVSRVIQWTMELFPKAVPLILNGSLTQVESKENIVLPNPEALNFGTPNYVDVHASNCGVPASRTAEVADALFAMFQQRADDELWVTAPIGFRFTTEGRGLLAPQYGRATCMIELPLLVGTDGALDTIDAFHQLLFEHYEGRPHWGQINRLMDKHWMKKMFPEWKTFVRTYGEYNNGAFDSPFTKQVGLRDLLAEAGSHG